MQPAHRYFIIHKPYNMESQFRVNYPASLLGDLHFAFPEGTHAIGRLDKHSEGLLLLTTDKRITKLLFQSAVPHRRTYLVQVKGKVSEESMQQLRNSVRIRISGDEWYSTPPCEVKLTSAPAFPSPKPSPPPQVENSWLLITITEGKFRQVRKMVAAIRHRCIRLIRVAIEDLELGTLQPGEVKEIDKETFFRQLKLAEPSGKV